MFWMTHTAQHPVTDSTFVDALAEHHWRGIGVPVNHRLAQHYCNQAVRRNKRDKHAIVYSNCYARLSNLTPNDKGVIHLVKKAATLFLNDPDDPDTMNKIGAALINLGPETLELGYQLLQEAFSRAPQMSEILYNMLAACYTHREFEAKHLLPSAMKFAQEDDNILYILALVFQHLDPGVEMLDFSTRLFELLERISDERLPQTTYLRAFLAEKYVLADPGPLFQKSYELGNPHATYRYVVNLPLKEEHQDEAESICHELLRKISTEDPTLTAHIQNHLGLVLQSKTCDEGQRDALNREAVEHFTSASFHPSLRAIASFNLGLMHQLGKAGEDSSPETAIPFFNTGREDQEIADDCSFEIARSLLMMHRKEEAIPLLDYLVEAGHGRGTIARAILKIVEAAESHEMNDSQTLLSEANELLKGARTITSEAQAFRAYLFACGLTNASGDVIFERKPERAIEVIEALQTNSEALAVLSNLLQNGLAGLTQMELAQAAEAAAAADDTRRSQDDPNEPGSIEAEAEAVDSTMVLNLKSMVANLQKRTVKTNVVLQALKASVMALGGKISMKASGSRFHVQAGSLKHTFHAPHGKRGAEVSGGALRVVREFMEDTVTVIISTQTSGGASAADAADVD